ncbi:MAG TPA: bifunctional riboflavin kinase/FAD synthetase [Burkholderiales bacterium]|nr:bifunctional riboflavin kinase/FAD synthetase [Burkholderiales bacterium]
MRITHGLHPRLSHASAITIGNFDGLHIGHQTMLRQLVSAASERDLTPCAVTFEPHPREFFNPGNAPARLSSLRDKLENMKSLGIEHVHICTFSQALAEMPALRFIDQILLQGLHMKYLLIGDDFRFGVRRSGDFALLQQQSSERNFTLEAMSSISADGLRISSTAVREALANGRFDVAQRLLGRPYQISGRVIHGEKLGRTLGFPTANISIRHDNLPLTGVFIVQVRGLGAEPLPAVASLGLRPTVNPAARPLLEIHLLNFSAEIYGRILRVDFLAKLRDEEKYPTLNALTQQIQRDVACAHDYFNHLSAV